MRSKVVVDQGPPVLLERRYRTDGAGMEYGTHRTGIRDFTEVCGP